MPSDISRRSDNDNNSNSFAMGLQERVVAQFRKPDGGAGQLAGWVMAHRRSNRRRNEKTLELLDLRRDDQLLEIGYGPGFAIKLASETITRGRIFGLDHSLTMFEQARRRNAREIAEGRVELLVGDILNPPAPLPAFDKIFSVNVVQFWPDPAATFAALKALLKPGGRIATTFMPRVGAAKPGQARAHAQRIQRLLEAQDFSHEVRWLSLGKTPAVCVLGRR